MPKRIRTSYSKEFKLSAVHLMKSKAMKPKEIFALLGNIDRQTVYRWIKEYDAEGEAAFDSKAIFSASSLRKQKKEIQDLKEENEILKKAIAYFADQKKKK